MSTPDVRTRLLAEITALAGTVQVFDLTNYVSLDDIKVEDQEQYILVDFVASSDRPTSIGDPDNLGFEESGSVAIHWMTPTGFSPTPALVAAEALRKGLRGRRYDALIVEEISPFMDFGSPVDSDSRWTGFTALLSYSQHSYG